MCHHQEKILSDFTETLENKGDHPMNAY